MLKAPIIDPSAPELSRSAHKLRVRRLGEIVLRAIDTTDQIRLICFILVDVASTGKEKKMPHRMDNTKAIFIFWCVLSTAFSIPSSSPTPQKLDDQLYTTRRTPKILIDFPGSKSKSKTSPSQTLLVGNLNEAKSTTTMSSESTTTHRSSSVEQPLYRLDGNNGQACILLQVDALITVKYRTKKGEDDEANIYVPTDATVTGNCDNENTVTMLLKWDAYILSWSFAKTPGGERWYVEKIELTYNSSDRHFVNIDQPNKTIRLSTGQKHSSMLFPTPVGKSYACSEETEVQLTDGKNHAIVLLRDMKLQPFKFKNNEFAVEFSCTSLSARGFRDETAPVAVGSTLAAAVLLTITGYAAYRYFKVKKVKYDTME
ncbi:uncharacterized protein LOC132910885 [Bombus pascuorum]|uniref:uncharacterized protein LOC132910885 n=1 Tax=Bombus pascuorum TaxID=65598 RepID=UPI00212FA841|nr:uncharacterized protein LOC132910885 [Bombus pascuorum]